MVSCYLNQIICHHKLELSGAVFNFLPVTYVGAICGTIFIIFVSCYFEHINLIGKMILKHIGLYSLWYYPITAFIPNRVSILVNETTYDNVVIKLLARIAAFTLTYIIIRVYERIKSV